MKPYRPRPYLAPLAALHALVLHVRHLAFNWGLLRSRRAAINTWVLGNITVGGTGKSPHVRLFVSELETLVGAGKVGILSRGYGRDEAGFGWVELASTPAEVGDEPLMLKRQMPDTPVAVCADRVAGVAQMRAERPELEWVVLDDAFQHRRLRADVSTVLLDATQPISKDRLIPAGRLRDLRSAVRRADSALLTRVARNEAEARAESGWPEGRPMWTTAMREGRLQPWSQAAFDRPVPTPRELPSERVRVVAVAGIARPERFMDGLAHGYQIVRREAYPDHHAFSRTEIKQWLVAYDTDGIVGIITTEKDATRLEPHRERLNRIPVYYVPLVAEWLDPEGARTWMREVVARTTRGTSAKNQDI